MTVARTELCQVAPSVAKVSPRVADATTKASEAIRLWREAMNDLHAALEAAWAEAETVAS
jgi:hypothetical protein